MIFMQWAFMNVIFTSMHDLFISFADAKIRTEFQLDDKRVSEWNGIVHD